MHKWSNITGRASARGSMGAIQYAAPVATGGVRTLMHVGNDDLIAEGLGAIGPDLASTSRTVGWIAAAVWAYARFGAEDPKLARKAMVWSLGGFAGSVLL